MEDNMVPVSTTNDEIFIPKKYKASCGTSDSAKEYEIKVTALLALKCCSEELQHFWLAANVDGCAPMDDIIIFKKMKNNDQGITYFLRLLHQDNPKYMLKEMFLSAKGDFSLKRYFDCYTKMQNTIHDETHKSDLIKHIRGNEMMFILFTNRGVTNDSQIVYKVNKASQLDTLGVKANIFEFNYQTFSDIDTHFLKSMFLLSNQPHIKDMDNEVKDVIKDLLHPLQLPDLGLIGVTEKFVSFVSEWSKGFLGGHYPLTKTHTLKKLTELLLLPYIFKLQEPYDRNEQVENIWYNLIRGKEVTIIDEVDDVVQRYVNDSTYLILRNGNIVDSITAINKKLLRVVGNPKTMSKCDKYELLWKTRKIPLLLQVSDSEGVKSIQEILNTFPGVFRVIILNKTKLRLETIKAFNSFINITDLNEEQRKQILQRPVKLQGRELTSIETLNIDTEQLYESLKVKDIVHILCGQFNIGREFEQLPKFFVEMSLTRTMLDIKVLKEAQPDIFVVQCKAFSSFKSFLTRQLTFSEDQIIQWDYLNKPNFESRIIIFDLTQNLQDIEEFCRNLTKTVHYLVWHGNDNLEWIKSNNTIDNLRTFKKPLESSKIESVFAKEVLNFFCQNKKPLLVSANPGMGKSVLINYFARNLPINLWVLKVNLPIYKDHYKKNWDRKNSQELQIKYFEQFVKEVLKYHGICNSIILDLVCEQYLKSNKMVLLLDGFDEVQIDCQNGAKKMIKFINESGYYMCVTTRPVLKTDLESVLNTFAVTLNSFTVDNQTSFLKNYFANVGNIEASDNKVILFVNKLLEAARRNLNDIKNRLTGIPRQTTLFAEAFKKDFIKYLEDGIFKNENFDLMYLHNHFQKEKMEIAYTKVESVSGDMIDHYKQFRALYALKHLFPNVDLEELKIDEQLQATKTFPHAMQIIQKDGITVADAESNVSFVHQIYAEFLVAEWLSENINTPNNALVQRLVQKAFELKLLVLRKLFDCFLEIDDGL